MENTYILYLDHDEVRHKYLKEKTKRAKLVVAKVMYILVEKGYIIYGEDKIIRLTDEGQCIAQKVYRKYVYLMEHLSKAVGDRSIT